MAASESVYRALFEGHLDEILVDEIREATNKSWALGRELFKQQIAETVDCHLELRTRGGNRRSTDFNRV